MIQKGKEGFPRALIFIPILASEDADSSYATVSAPELRLGLEGQSLWQRVGNTTARARGHHPRQATCSCRYPAEVWVRPGLEAPWLSRSREGELGVEVLLNTKVPVPLATSYPWEAGGRNCVTQA